MSPFEFHLPVRIIFGPGVSSEAGKAVSAFGKTCLVVTTPWIPSQAEAFEYIMEGIRSEGVKVHLFDKACPNPTLPSVMEASETAKEVGAEVILGLGGGSALDTAKAAAVGAVHEGPLWEYRFSGEKEPTDRTLPIITIPTTSGTGSHVTMISVFTNEKTGIKSGIRSRHIFPKVSLADPSLTLSMPPYLTAVTGFDAFTHTFESYIHKKANPFMDALALEAMETIIEYLPKAVADGSDEEARRQMAYGDTLAGITMTHVGTTLPHAMGQPISGRAPHVSHGESLALVYPEFLKFTYKASARKFARAARIFDKTRNYRTDEEAAEALAGIVKEFTRGVGVDPTLASLNVDVNIIDKVIEDCIAFPNIHNNPVTPSKEELKTMFLRMA